jgi:hypothetical protein
MKYQFLSLSLNKLIPWFILLTIVLTIHSCKDDPITPPKPEAKLDLSVDDVSCTEAWLSVKIENLSLPLDIELMNDSILLKTYYSINSPDTVLYIDSLLPNKPYNFQLTNLSSGVKSNTASTVTLDTTSHNFTWHTWTFGDVGGSGIYDIAIINENNIWAVGKITLADTSQNGYTDYNAAHWNGSEWSLHRFMFYTICGQSSLSSYPATSIIVFNENDIIISAGGRQLIRINGETQIKTICAPFSIIINKIWGTSSNDLYVVGSYGNIARYYNGNWYKIESGTDLHFNDIYGAADPKTGELQILAVGSRNNPMGKCIFQISGNKAEEISTEPIQGQLISIWFKPGRHYYVVGDGIYEKRLLSENKWNNEPLEITRYGTSGVRGNALNDVFVVGAFGEILHYNGISWKSFLNELGLINGSYRPIVCKGDLVVIAGGEGSQAKILLGKRNN